MAKSKTKHDAKRRMARIWRNVDVAIQMLATEYQLFAPHHPEMAQNLEIIAKELMIVQSQLEDFWREAWGDLPQDLNVWAE